MKSEMKSVLTQKQRLLLDFIETFVEEEGYSPTLEEMALGIGVLLRDDREQVAVLLERALLLPRWPAGGDLRQRGHSRRH